MKRLLPVLALCFAIEAQASTCIVNFTTGTPEVMDAMKKNGWDFDNYHQVCTKLSKANASILLTGTATVLGGTSIAWVSAYVKDANSSIVTTNTGGISTRQNSHPSMDTAENLLHVAVNQAMNEIDFDKAIADLNAERRKARAVAAPKSK